MDDKLIENMPSELAKLELKHLFAFRLDIREMIIIGDATGIFRRVGIIQGGHFEGDRLSGKVLDSGNDFQTVRNDCVTNVDVRMILRTDDGVNITMKYTGVRAGDDEVIKRLDSGQAVSPSEYYLRISPTFETSSPKYDWLNNVVCVGTGHREAAGPLYNVFEVA